jgi:hypothetical protein
MSAHGHKPKNRKSHHAEDVCAAGPPCIPAVESPGAAGSGIPVPNVNMGMPVVRSSIEDAHATDNDIQPSVHGSPVTGILPFIDAVTDKVTLPCDDDTLPSAVDLTRHCHMPQIDETSTIGPVFMRADQEYGNISECPVRSKIRFYVGDISCLLLFINLVEFFFNNLTRKPFWTYSNTDLSQIIYEFMYWNYITVER